MYHNQNDLYYKAWQRLPERFRKPNNLDLYYVLYGGYGEIEKGFASINDSRNIDKAKGETLDKLGANVGQVRNGEDDDLYRQLIKVRILANMSIGNIPTINKVMSILVKDIYLGISEAWPYERYLNEPASIFLKLKPKFNNFPEDIIEKIKAAGVRVYFDFIYSSDINLFSKYGTYNYPAFLCGEHPCGDIPYVFAEAQRLVSDLNIEAGSNYGKNYYPTVGKIKSGDLESGEVTEIIYATDFASDNVYSFERGE